jgi:hypothetical protein
MATRKPKSPSGRSARRPSPDASTAPSLPAARKRRGRGRTALPESERKARLIQTRVDDGLDATLRHEARLRRVTVSQLIRHVLEDTFNLVDNIVAGSANLAAAVRRDARRIADSAQGLREPAPPVASAPAPAPAPVRAAAPVPAAPARAVRRDPRLDEVDAWQEVRVNREVTCASCGTALPRGSAALLGLLLTAPSPASSSSSSRQARLWICLACGDTLAG